MTINEVAPPGFGHTKGDKEKGVKKGGTAAAFDRARKEGRFKGSKSDMFAIMWSQKNKGDKPHYKPGTNKKYKKYQDEDWKPEIEVIDTKKRKKEAEKKRKAAADSLPPHLRLDVMKKAFSSANEETTFKQRDKELKKTSAARNQRYKDLHKKTGDGNTDVNESQYEKLKKKIGSKKMHTKPAIVNWRDEFDYVQEGAAWTKKSGKNPEGGLNEKGRKSYERENPGSDLKAPQPEGGSRKKSFCARMGGMKKKLTSAKTANDPDSRINKSLRKWKCNEESQYEKGNRLGFSGDLKTDAERYRVPRGPGGNPKRIGDKVRSFNDKQPLGQLKVKYGADKVREYYKKNKGVDEGYHNIDGEKYLKLPKKVAKGVKRDSDERHGLGKVKDAVTDTLGITNTKRDGVRKHSGLKGQLQMQNSYEPEGKLAESDVPRNSMGKPIRIKDKIKAAKGFIPHKGKSTTEGVTYGYKGKKYKKLPASAKTPAGWGNDDRSELGKAKDAITDKLGITNTKKHGVLAKEDADYKSFMKNVQDAKDRVKKKTDDRKKKDAVYVDRVKKGIRFYDKKGKGHIRGGKKVYD